MALNQYDIVLVGLDPTVGSEMQKTRPCLIISPDEINHHLRTIIVAPMTTARKKYPTRVKLGRGEHKGWVALDQVRVIDKARVIKTLGRITTKESLAVKGVLREMFVD